MTTRTHFLALALALVASTASPLAAQLIRVPKPGDAARPISASVSAGYLLTASRFDGVSGRFWSLGDGIQYRGSLELGTRSGAIGLTGTLATVPISRSGVLGSDGDITLRQLLVTFRSPEGQTFYQIFEAGAGLSQWASYSGTDVLSAEDRKARNGLAIMIGYGFGFALGERMSFNVVQDASTIIGSGEGLPAGERRSQQQYITRMGLRYRFTGAR
jgi:hypothetical protein